ncbi:MAG: preprotein translocase subunit SecE [Elusimicrobia bacterium]|nr:preprotein translocase subunit SecE [Elusimicrobiota bacterium]
MLENVTLFFKESYEELKKVTWMTRKVVMGSTAVIIVLIFIVSLFIALIDFICMRAVAIIL